MDYSNPKRVLTAVLLVLGLLAGSVDAGNTYIVSGGSAADINAAIAKALPGDTIIVRKGVYSGTVIVNKDRLTLIGRRAVLDAEYLGNTLAVTADQVTIQGFTLVNGRYGIYAVSPGGSVDGLQLRKNRVEAASLGGILVHGDNASLRLNQVLCCVGIGIETRAVNQLASTTQLVGNQVSRCAAEGILAYGGQLFVERNRTDHNGAHGIDVSTELLPYNPVGGQIGASSVLGNRSWENQGCGLSIYDELSPGMVVRSNRATGNTADAGLLVVGRGIVVEHNHAVGNNMGVAAWGSGYLLKGNQLLRNLSHGLFLDGFQNEVLRTRARDNGGCGLMIQDFSDWGGNLLLGNSVARNGRDGIRIIGQDNVVHGNRIHLNLGDGIDLNDAQPGNKITRNVASRNGHEGIDNSGVGTLISDNTCLQNAHGEGPDIAGTGDGGVGSMDPASSGNKMSPGAPGAPQPDPSVTAARLDLL